MFNIVVHKLDNGTCVAHTNGFVLPQFDYRDTVALAEAL